MHCWVRNHCDSQIGKRNSPRQYPAKAIGHRSLAEPIADPTSNVADAMNKESFFRKAQIFVATHTTVLLLMLANFAREQWFQESTAPDKQLATAVVSKVSFTGADNPIDLTAPLEPRFLNAAGRDSIPFSRDNFA